jgi:RNA polymerase sigma factor (sigma-70 family)
MKKDFIFGENGYVVRNEIAEAYRKEMARFQPLDADEVRELIVRAHEGDMKARTKVINHNLRIVWSIAANFGGMDNFMDILQNGNYGLCVAVDTFDVSRETMFTTWALMMVVKYINIGLTNESRVVRVRADLVRKIDYTSVSVDAPIANDEDGEKTLLDFMASDMSADNFSEVEAMRVKINYLMRGLKDVEKAVICGLFGFGCAEETENTLSTKFGLTRERVRQIKWEALEKMAKLG